MRSKAGILNSRSASLLLAGVIVAGLLYSLRRWNWIGPSPLERPPSGTSRLSQPRNSPASRESDSEPALDAGTSTNVERIADEVFVQPGDASATSNLSQDDVRSAMRATMEVEYREMNLGQLMGERETITAALKELSNPIIMQRFRDNLADFVSSGGDYAVSETDRTEIVGIQTRPGEGTYRTVLPRSDYPELYDLRDRQTLLTRLIHQSRVDLAKRNQ